MKAKGILTAALSSFVAVCVVVLVAQEVRRHMGRPAAGAGSTRPRPFERLIVYCFHRSVRCNTCIKMEQYTKEALVSDFADQLEDGSIQCQVVDVEQPENDHFLDDYQFVGPAVVLVWIHGEATTHWENLPDIVPLLDQKPLFMEYLRKRVQAVLMAPFSWQENDGWNVAGHR